MPIAQQIQISDSPLAERIRFATGNRLPLSQRCAISDSPLARLCRFDDSPQAREIDLDVLSLGLGFYQDVHLPGGALNQSGNDAAYLEKVATIADLTGNGCHAEQSTDANRGTMLRRSGQTFLHLPNVTGNTLTLPLANGSYDYTVIYSNNDFAEATGTISASGGVMTIGPTGANFVNRRVARILLSQSSAIIADINFANVGHGATSFVCETGQTCTINSTGNNPATVIGRSQVRGDGLTTFYDFAAPVSLFQNTGYGMLGGVFRSFDTITNAKAVTSFSNNASLTRLTLVVNQTTANRFQFGGRREDGDGFQSVVSSGNHGSRYRVILGAADYTNARAEIFQDGVSAGVLDPFQTTGNTSNTASTRARLFAEQSATPVGFFNGDISIFLGTRNKPTAAQLVALQRYLAAGSNIAYLG